MTMARCNDLPASARSRHATCQLLQTSRIRAVWLVLLLAVPERADGQCDWPGAFRMEGLRGPAGDALLKESPCSSHVHPSLVQTE